MLRVFLRRTTDYISVALERGLGCHFGRYEVVCDPFVADLQWADYEELDFQAALDDRKKWICAYSIRKAITRKHFLSQTIREYVAKHPECQLARAAPESWTLEVDYAEFLDDALDDAFELRGELEQNEALANSERRWFILKPGMSDRGAGLRLFSTIGELTSIFKENEIEEDLEVDGNLMSSDDSDNRIVPPGVMTSDMRFFVVQEYLSRPLLLKGIQNRKFHIRAYTLCLSSLKVFVHKNLLLLSTQQSYQAPSFEADQLPKHLTNTCYQKDFNETGSDEAFVHSFWAIKDAAFPSTSVWQQIKDITKELFQAAVAQPVNFQTLPNAFELFGVDYMVTDDLQVHLLEVNAYPDFAQTGTKLQFLIDEVIDDTVTLVSKSMNHALGQTTDATVQGQGATSKFEQCLDLDLLRT